MHVGVMTQKEDNLKIIKGKCDDNKIAMWRMSKNRHGLGIEPCEEK
jgi:hypothetical protein